MIVETVRLSEKAKNQLIQIKRKTGIEQWNVLCRWALMLSLVEKHPPPQEEMSTDSSIDIAWKTFAGILDPAITALVRFQFNNECSKETQLDIGQFFKLHLHRGISYLSSREFNSVSCLFESSSRSSLPASKKNTN